MTIADAPQVGFVALLAVAFVVAPVAPPSSESPVVERIVIHGNTRTRDKVIRRELGITETEPVDAFELDGARRRLRALGYFLVAAVSERRGSEPGLVTIAVDVVEVPHASAGFYSAENFIAICAITQTR